MAKDAIVDEAMAARFSTEKVARPYERWVEAEGLDILAGHYIPDLRTVELKPWERRGGRGVFINHEASHMSNDCYVCEIPAGGKLAPQRQLFEEMVLILDGHGSTRVWNSAGAEVTFEWQPGSIFAIPLNTSHQHFNASGSQPARYVSSTNLPPIINMFDNADFVFNNPYDFTERFAGEPDYFAPKGEQKGFLLDTNFVADAANLPLIEAKERGAGGGHIRFKMAHGSLTSHISQFPTATYKKGHRHGPGAHVIVLSGTGYSLMWPEGDEPKRYEWGPGSLIIPPDNWFHQHFNAGAQPARYLAFKQGGIVSASNAQGVPKAWISQRIGGDQVDYADESHVVRETFRKALAEVGLEPQMDDAYEAELADLPPKPGKLPSEA